MATLNANRLEMKRNNRALFVGATGSGKTTLAKGLMYGIKNIAIIDPKRTFTLPESWGATITTDRDEVEGWDKETPIIYRPGPEIIEDPFAADWFFQWAYHRGNTLVYVDELMMVCKESRPSPGYAACIQLGREIGVGTWSATQRPSRVPRIALSESEDIFAFRLRLEDDRKRIASVSDDAIMANEAKGHGFYHYNENKQTLVYYSGAKVSKGLV